MPPDGPPAGSRPDVPARVRGEALGRATIGVGLLPQALAGISVGPVAIGLDVVRIAAEGRGIVGDGLIVVAPAGMGLAAVVVGPGVGRIEAKGGVEIGDGLVVRARFLWARPRLL